MMNYLHAKGFVGTRGGGGNNVQKIVFCFLICPIQKVAVSAQKSSHTCIKMGTKVQYAKTWTDSELTCDG